MWTFTIYEIITVYNEPATFLEGGGSYPLTPRKIQILKQESSHNIQLASQPWGRSQPLESSKTMSEFKREVDGCCEDREKPALHKKKDHQSHHTTNRTCFALTLFGRCCSQNEIDTRKKSILECYSKSLRFEVLLIEVRVSSISSIFDYFVAYTNLTLAFQMSSVTFTSAQISVHCDL